MSYICMGRLKPSIKEMFFAFERSSNAKNISPNNS